MEKKKMKLWKKILIVLCIILLIVAIFITRKAVILSALDQKVSDYENNYQNIHIKTIFNYADYNTTIERYIKDNVDKIIMERTEEDGTKVKLTQVTYPNERKMFVEAENNKVMYVSEELAPTRGAHIENTADTSYNTIINFAYSNNLLGHILSAFVTGIKTVEVDGKTCYELSSTLNPMYLYTANTKSMKAYVDKETGLPVKKVEIINENGTTVENVTTYAYEFNVVTDENMAEPDNTEYKLSK